VAGIPAEKIGDTDAFRDDLNLDSLSLLEIGVDVDFNFKLGLPDERFKEIGSVDAMVRLVEERLAELTPVASA
jgi:acyl carrier protein